MKKILVNIQWADKLIDLLVVIVGITIAFSLNNWNNNRRDNKLKTTYLSSLHNDLKKDSANLASAHSEILKEQNLLDTLFYLVSQEDTERANVIGASFSNVGER